MAGEMDQKKVAIVFGGVSPEHDVSILTGMQACFALDQSMYEAIPIYIDTKGTWWAGDGLIEHHQKIVNGCNYKGISQVEVGPGGFYHNGQPYQSIDVCLIALHGGDGENGAIQGLFEVNQLPYTGVRKTGASVAMNKWLTKKLLAALGVNVLSDHLLNKLPGQNHYTIAQLKALKLTFPICVKPCSLGSSVGVGFADDVETLHALLLDLFQMDDAVLIEPAVQSLKEFNVSVRKDICGDIVLSAVESPVADAWLDFDQKYRQGSQSKKQSASGLINLSREFGPKMPKNMLNQLELEAKIAFEAFGGYGAPRIDFLADMSQGKLWLNEVNPTPGSFGHYLWTAKDQKQGFVWLLNHLLAEAQQAGFLNSDQDPVPKLARIFKRNMA